MMSSQKPGCFFILLKWIRKIFGFRPPLPPYRPARFLSAAELAFYQVLKTALGSGLTVCPKVRVADVIETPKTEGHRQQFNRICARHFDFVLCEPESMRPVAFVELDDASHGAEKVRKSDAFKDAVARQAGIPLVRFPVRKSYSAEGIRKSLAFVRSRSPRTPRR